MDRECYEKITAALEGLEETRITPVPEGDDNAPYVTIEYGGTTTAGMVMSALDKAVLLLHKRPLGMGDADLRVEPDISFPGALTFHDRRPCGGYRG